MKFLLNMNLPRELGRRLAEHGHAYRHVGDINMARASDMEIIAEARKNGEVILTHDLDYGHLLAFSGEAAPSVIIFRTRNTHVSKLFSRMMNAWKEIDEPLQVGAIVVIEDGAVRTRKLPIVQDL